MRHSDNWRRWKSIGFIGFGVILLLLPKQARTKPVKLQPKALQTTIDLTKWGLSSPKEIRLGQLGIIYTKKGPQLQVYKLKSYIPQPQKKPILRGVPPIHKNCFLLSHFSMGNTNRLGGYFNHFQRTPSKAKIGIKKGHDKRYALSLQFDRKKKGFCGFWMHLFDFKQAVSERIYLNASPFKWLVFWVKGKQGNEHIRLKVADAYWEKKGDALPVGTIAEFLRSKRITKQWQQVAIPLSRFPKRIKKEQLASMVFEALRGSGQISLKTTALCLSKKHWPTLPPPRSKKQRAQMQRAMKRGKDLATWFWHTQPLLNSHKKQKEVAQFLKKQKFTHIFIQLPNRPKSLKKAWPKQLQTAKWRRLIKRLHQNGIKVLALEGFKEYALPKWHSRVKQTVAQVIAYNRSVTAIERFDGIRYDIEPYLLQEFRGKKKEWLMQHYLTLLQDLTAMSHAASLTFGVDIPFWFDARHPETGQQSLISFKGAAKTLSSHIIEIVDDVGIMDYRTQAYGADGIITHALGELRYASLANKRVYIGLETLPLPHEKLLPFRGTAKTNKNARTNDKNGHKTQFYAFLHFQNAKKVLVHLVPHRLLPMWKKRQPTLLSHPQQWYMWPINRSIYVSSNKLSFAYLGWPSLTTALHQSKRELQRYKSFTGFAVHSYKSYRALLAKHKTKPYSSSH